MIFSIIFILLIALGIGLPLSLLIASKGNLLGRLGISFPLGIGIFTLGMYLSNLLGLRFTPLNNFLLFLLLSIPILLFEKGRIKKYFVEFYHSAKNVQLSLDEKVILGVLGFFVVSSFINTFYWPVYSWDSLVLYDFRGRVLAMTGFIKDAFFSNYYVSYPLLTSLSHSVIYLSGGKNPQFLYSLFYLSLGLCFYGLLREIISRRLSLLFTTLLLTVPLVFEHSLISYTNLPYTAFLSLGVIYYYLWDRKREPGYLVLSAVLVGLSTWTRGIEPYWLGIFLIVVIVSLLRRKLFDVVIYSLFFFPIQQVWKIFQNSLQGLPQSIVGEVASNTGILSNALDLNRWSQVLGYLYQYIINPWGAVFSAFILAFLFSFIIKKQKESFLIFSITFVLLSLLLLGTFIYSFTAKNWMEIGDAANRMSMIFYPLFIYCTAVVMGEYDEG